MFSEKRSLAWPREASFRFVGVVCLKLAREVYAGKARVPVVDYEANAITYCYDDWPSIPTDGVLMEFRLVYKGKLPAASQSDNRAKEKHHIRKAIHPQLRELWRTHPTLRMIDSPTPQSLIGFNVVIDGKTRTQRIAERFSRCGFNFVPLISEEFGIVACSLDVLLLSREQPGGLIRNGGDLDNRLKVLFDGLRMVEECQEVQGQSPSDDEKPFHCLLRDDKLITELKVTADRLLIPLEPGERESDVHLVIKVRTIAFNEGNGLISPLG